MLTFNFLLIFRLVFALCFDCGFQDIEGDPELIDDTEFYQELLREFLESSDPASIGLYILHVCSRLIEVTFQFGGFPVERVS